MGTGPKRRDYDDGRPSYLPRLDGIPDTLGPSYGTQEDYAARKIAIASLAELEAVLSAPRSIGIGHDQPPEGIDEEQPAGIGGLRPIVQELCEELEKHELNTGFVKRLVNTLGGAVVATAQWTAKSPASLLTRR